MLCVSTISVFELLGSTLPNCLRAMPGFKSFVSFESITNCCTFAFGRGDILRADDEIVIRIEWWILPLFQHLERRSVFVVVAAYWLCYRQTGACENHEQGERGQL